MYGSQRPPHYAGEQQNPPQPEWRSHQPTPSATYNPGTYGPIHPNTHTISPSPSVSPAPSADTSSWGVRYNQHMAQAPPPPPPLPPRNDLYSAPSPPPPPPPPRPTSSSNQPPASAPTWDYTTTYTQPSHGPPAPPPRPPVPAAYQTELQQVAQPWQTSQQAGQQNYTPQYSHHPPTHHYDPYAQQVPQAQSAMYSSVIPDQTGTNYYQTPVPPLSSPPTVPISAPPQPPPVIAQNPDAQWTSQPNSLATGASILGHGSVSDWEHFTSTPGDVDDQELYQRKQNTEQSMTQTNLAYMPQHSVHTYTQQYTPVSSQIPTPSSPDHNPQYSVPIQNSSPLKSQVVTQSTYPPRNDSAQSQDSAVSPAERSDTIDGVIQAWNQHPISPIIKPQGETYAPSPPPMSAKAASPVMSKPASPQSLRTQSQPLQTPLSSASQGDSPPVTSSESQAGEQAKQIEQNTGRAAAPIASEPLSSQVKMLDPYDDLDPWSKSSLFRYVTMLRKEAVAESEEEKYKIFSGFAAKEARLREVLYNIETTDKETKPANSTIMPNNSKVADSKGSRAAPVPDSAGLIPVETEAGVQQTPKNRDDADSDDIPYSPGGRPILSKGPTQSLAQDQGTLHRSMSNPSGQSNNPLGNDSVTQAQNNIIAGQNDPALRSTSVPPSMNHSAASQGMLPLISEPPRPVYTPFRYAEGPQRGSEALSIAQPGFQAYSALRQASAESGRAMSAAPLLQTPTKPGMSPRKTTGNIQPDETFLGIIREKSVSYRGKSDLPVSESVIEELGALIPEPFPTFEESVKISSLKKKADVYSDDFRYIYVTKGNWEMSGRDRREGLEKERLARQDASESHIDSLFNEKEIGYADINPLEEKFRQEEARTQLEEERKELDSYIRKVYNPLDTRLKEEIVEIKALYQRALDELSHDKIHANSNSMYQISRTMKVINSLAGKLESRYQKRLDLGLDREQHRKKAERRPLVFLGDSRALKKLDADFEKMEKQNIVEAAKDRDERANKLTDVFDEAILHALGIHQRVLDDTATKTRKLDVGIVERSNLPEADKELLLRSIAALTKLLAEDAESMLTSFKEADSRLNEADYSVSVAEAQYANADPEVFRRLEEEKRKEDDKIQEDHNSKLESIKKAPVEISSKVDEILRAINKEPGIGTGPWRRPAALMINSLNPSQPQSRNRSRSPSAVLPSTVDAFPLDGEEPHPAEALMPGPLRQQPAETEQQERLRKALEDAKKRNAAKNFST